MQPSTVTLDHPTVKTELSSEMSTLLFICSWAAFKLRPLDWILSGAILSVCLYPALYLADSDLLTWLPSLTTNLLHQVHLSGDHWTFGRICGSAVFLWVLRDCALWWWGHCPCWPYCHPWFQFSFSYRVDYPSYSLKQGVTVILIHFAWTPKLVTGLGLDKWL